MTSKPPSGENTQAAHGAKTASDSKPAKIFSSVVYLFVSLCTCTIVIWNLTTNSEKETPTYFFLTNLWNISVAVMWIYYLSRRACSGGTYKEHILLAMAPIGPAITLVYIGGWYVSKKGMPGTDGSWVSNAQSIWLHFVNPTILYGWAIFTTDTLDTHAITFSWMFIYTYFLFFVTLYLSMDTIMYKDFFKAGTGTFGTGVLVSGMVVVLILSYYLLIVLRRIRHTRKRKKQSKPCRTRHKESINDRL
jgi:hypothetical protein